MRNEALSRCSISKEIPCSLLKFETVLDTLDATQKFPTYWSHWRGTPSFMAELNLSPFSTPDLDMRVNNPALSGKGSQRSCRTSGGGQSHIETQEEASWIMPHSKRHGFPRPFKIRPDVRVTLRMKSQHEGALTPQLHRLKKAADSKYYSTSGLSPHEQLVRQAEFRSSTQDEA